MSHEHILLTLEEKRYPSLGLLIVGLVVPHCTTFMHEHKASKSKDRI